MAKLVRDVKAIEDSLEKIREKIGMDNSDWLVIDELVSSIIEGEKHKEFKKKKNIKADFEGINVKQDVDRIANFLKNSPILYNRSKKELLTVEKELCDMEHEAECFIDKSNEEKIEFYDDLKRLREIRRKYKNFLLLVNPVMTYVSKHKKATEELSDLVAKVSKLDKILIEWVYHPRVKKYSSEELENFKSNYKN